MNEVFPKVTKCTFHKYGPSGSITTHDGLCILALNIINEKIYVFLWFWFVAVALFSALAILYRMFMLLVPSFRSNAIMARTLYQVDKNTVNDVLSCPTHSWADQVTINEGKEVLEIKDKPFIFSDWRLLGGLSSFQKPASCSNEGNKQNINGFV